MVSHSSAHQCSVLWRNRCKKQDGGSLTSAGDVVSSPTGLAALGAEGSAVLAPGTPVGGGAKRGGVRGDDVM